jgi:hypothetical protein
MKSTLIQQETKQSKYPYIGIYKDNNVMVLFTSERTGVCVFSLSKLSPLGEYYESWAEEEFNRYDGEVILSND